MRHCSLRSRMQWPRANHPHAAGAGMGGFASAPTVLAACSYELPAVLHLLGGHHVADRDPGNADQPGADPSARRLPFAA